MSNAAVFAYVIPEAVRHLYPAGSTWLRVEAFGKVYMGVWREGKDSDFVEVSLSESGETYQGTEVDADLHYTTLTDFNHQTGITTTRHIVATGEMMRHMESNRRRKAAAIRRKYA